MKPVDAEAVKAARVANPGLSLKKIGALFGISGERVRQIVFNVTRAPKPRKAKWHDGVDWSKTNSQIQQERGVNKNTIAAMRSRKGHKPAKWFEDETIDWTLSNHELGNLLNKHPNYISRIRCSLNKYPYNQSL